MGKLISFAVNDAVMTPEEIEKAQFQKYILEYIQIS